MPDLDVELSWPATGEQFLLELSEDLAAPDLWSPAGLPPVLRDGRYFLPLPIAAPLQFFRLRRLTVSPDLFTLLAHTPLDGARGVGLTEKVFFLLSEAADAATLNDLSFSAQSAQTPLPLTIVPMSDGSGLWLFFDSSLPDRSRITVTVKGDDVLAASDASPLDADGDGSPGGSYAFSFTTASLAGLPGTSLTGLVVSTGPDMLAYTADDWDAGPDGAPGTGDDLYKLPPRRQPVPK